MSQADDVYPEDVLTQDEIEDVLNTLAALDQQIILTNIAKHNVCNELRKKLERHGLPRAGARAVAAQIKARRDNARREQNRTVINAVNSAPFARVNSTPTTRA